MKKLMIAAAIVCAAAFAHAGQYNWGLASCDYTDHEGQALETASAFIYLGTVGVTADGSAFDLSVATFLDSCSSAEFDWENYAYGKTFTDPLQSSELITKNAGDAYSIVILENGADTLAGYEGYYTIVNGVSVEGTIPGTTPVKFAQLVDAATSVATTSQMSAVPEPTSGLLLLLGVAGLALKRRRA